MGDLRADGEMTVELLVDSMPFNHEVKRCVMTWNLEMVGVGLQRDGGLEALGYEFQ